MSRVHELRIALTVDDYDRAVAFYRHFGFTHSPTDARHLFMIIKDIRLAAGRKA